MKVKLLKKIREDWTLKQYYDGMFWEWSLVKNDYSQSYDLKGPNTINYFCINYLYVGINYWLNHNKKLTINKNKKKYNEA